jgi:four helix bundle protein
LIRSSTSASANYRAARLAQSKGAFISKVSIVVEEADESAMWLKMVIDKNLLPSRFSSELVRIRNEALELTSILIATRKTMTSNK